MPIDVLASAPHYADHLAAVFGALPEEARGDFLATGPDVANRIRALGFAPSTRSASDNPVLVASYGDLGRARLGMRRTRLAIMEHGSGQSYGGRPLSGRHGSYAGGRGREASLFLHPGHHPADLDRRAYPRARVEVVGAPILDTLPARVGDPDRVVAFSFHFNAGIAPEAKTAYPWIFPAILDLRERFALLGHAHPRFFPVVSRRYKAAGIEAVADFRDVCRRADVYVCDNSSTLFAFAATGRPVVVLNPPWYDKRVNHGLRFWDAASVGVNCDNPADLEACITEALRDKVAARKRRETALDLVYAYRTGASQRAAEVLQEWAA